MNLILLSATQEAQLALGAGSCHEQFAGNLSFGPGGGRPCIPAPAEAWAAL